MKRIASKTFALAFLVFTSFQLQAQEYKVSVGSQGVKLVLNELNKVEVEGTTGSEIIFTTTNRSSKHNERAEGLKPINSQGLSDNTNIGLSVVEAGGVVEVNQISRRSSTRYLIKVPKNVTVAYEHSSVHGSTFRARDLESELEISTNHSSVELTNVTGPMTVNTVHGKIEAVFTTLNQDAPTAIASSHGLVDIALPANTKADLRLKTGWGEIFTDMNIEYDRSDADIRRQNSSTVRGKLNGGGVTLDLKTSHSNIYLRTKK